MLESISKLGTTLSEVEQKTINGGGLDCSNLPDGKICGGGGAECCSGSCCYGNCILGICIDP